MNSDNDARSSDARFSKPAISCRDDTCRATLGAAISLPAADLLTAIDGDDVATDADDSGSPANRDGMSVDDSIDEHDADEASMNPRFSVTTGAWADRVQGLAVHPVTGVDANRVWVEGAP